MFRHLAIAFALSLGAAPAVAQQPGAPLPLFPTGPSDPVRSQPPPSGFREEKLAPLPPAPEQPRPPESRQPEARLPDPPPPPPAPRDDLQPPSGPMAPPGTSDAAAADRVFCTQQVTYRIADGSALPARYRDFVGIWSDAAWTPQLCAALIVEEVTADGTARLVYVFGPMGSGRVGAGGGVLRGTGVIRGGELRFQNSDGSQFAFRPAYSDLDGQLRTPQGQTYQATFKKTM